MKMLNSTWAMAVAVLLLPAAWSQDQPPAPARPRFEVASIKPNPGCQNKPPQPGPRTFTPSPDRMEMPCVSLKSLIQTAYGTFGDDAAMNPAPLHMEGGPSWMQSEHYSLSAKAEGPVRTELLGGPMPARGCRIVAQFHGPGLKPFEQSPTDAAAFPASPHCATVKVASEGAASPSASGA